MSLSLYTSERNEIVSQRHNGAFWKPCPGTTKGYLCCGYQILTPLTGCGMYCRFCILQSYLESQKQTLFENFDDLEKEVVEKMKLRSGILRFGTGEFADSLFSEDQTHACSRIARLLQPYENVVVEFKTKSDNIEPLRAIQHPGKVIIGFSMNTPRMIELHERNTASLDARLQAAKKCLDMGFWIAFHFDPIIYYQQWESEYRETVKRIFETVGSADRIAWWSLGGFRTIPALKTLLREHDCELPLFSSEMILGQDRKLRYFRPQRVEFYRAIQEEAMDHDEETPLYLCMESPEVWEDAGMKWRIPNGLPSYLDTRAKKMLDLQS